MKNQRIFDFPTPKFERKACFAACLSGNTESDLNNATDKYDNYFQRLLTMKYYEINNELFFVIIA